MALATDTLKDPYHCSNCGYMFFSPKTEERITECPDCGPNAKKRKAMRMIQHKIQRLNKMLQEGIYE